MNLCKSNIPSINLHTNGILDDKQYFCDLCQLILTLREVPVKKKKIDLLSKLMSANSTLVDIGQSKLTHLDEYHDDQVKHLRKLFDSKVVVNIDVLLRPPCGHQQDYILLESWSISISAKKNEKQICRNSLFQAVTSFLHFSQLSAWICKYKKTEMPSVIDFRVSPSGQFCRKSFGDQTTSSHYFPETLATPSPSPVCKSFKIRVDCAARRQHMPLVTCSQCFHTDNHANNGNAVVQQSPTQPPPQPSPLGQQTTLPHNHDASISQSDDSLFPQSVAGSASPRSPSRTETLANSRPPLSQSLSTPHLTTPHLTTPHLTTHCTDSSVPQLSPPYIVSCSSLATPPPSVVRPTYQNDGKLANTDAQYPVATPTNGLDTPRYGIETPPYRLDMPSYSRVIPSASVVSSSPCQTPSPVSSATPMLISPLHPVFSIGDSASAQSRHQVAPPCSASTSSSATTNQLNKPPTPFAHGDVRRRAHHRSKQLPQHAKRCRLNNNNLGDLDHHDDHDNNDDAHGNHDNANSSVAPIHRASPVSLMLNDLASKMDITATTSEDEDDEKEFFAKSKCIRNIFNIKRPKSSAISIKSSAKTTLALKSSPAPMKRSTSDCFDYDSTLDSSRAIKNSISCANLSNRHKEGSISLFTGSSSTPSLSSRLLGNFEESLLNCCIEPTSIIYDFKVDLSASGNFKHQRLNVNAMFYTLNDNDTPSPYLCHIPLNTLGKKGYQIPPSGTIQLTLFNPNNSVVKMFVIVYDLKQMPPLSTTFMRQRTLYTPVADKNAPSYLRYLIHLRCTSSKSRHIYLHSDIRIIVGQDKFEFHSQVASYELRSFTEYPSSPQFSLRT